MKLQKFVLLALIGVLFGMVLKTESQSVTSCSSSTCSNGGTCIPTSPPTCVCSGPWTGDFCTTGVPQPCDTNPCENNGACHNTGTTHMCTCSNGYSGLNCEVEPPCNSNPCQNAGVCHNTGTSYMCTCSDGYSGLSCEVDPPCDGNPCQNGGTCHPTGNTYVCTCNTQYSGSNCEVDNTASCNPNPCQNGGTCNELAMGYSCVCRAGFDGGNCEIDVDECANNPCLNGGICVDGVGSFSCDCPDGFTGSQCETEEDACSPNPCQNGGTCTANGNSVSCDCPDNYAGNRCQNSQEDACSPNPCQNGGTCTANGNSVSCNCPDNYIGNRCQNSAPQEGSARRDPHMTTFDGHRYNFQGLCWYTLVKVCNSDLHKFDISTLFEPRPYDGIELKTRPVTVIVSVDDESVILNKDNTYFVRKSLGNGEFMASKATKMNITTEVDKIIVKLHDIKLTVTWIAGDHMVFTDLADPRYYGHVCGLLGDADGNPENDFTKPDGSITKEIMDFGESWKVDKLTCPEYEYL